MYASGRSGGVGSVPKRLLTAKVPVSVDSLGTSKPDDTSSKMSGFDVEGFFLALKRREPWRAKAKCLGAGTKIFFPDRGASRKEAKAMCASCPVAKQCREHAEANEEYGIWSGETMHRGRDHSNDEIEESVGTDIVERDLGTGVRELPEPLEQHVSGETAAACG